MKPIKFTDKWGEEYNIIFTRDKYANNGRLYVGCLCEDEEYGGYFPYSDVTVNLDSYLPNGNYAFLDTNNGDDKLFELMFEKGYMEKVKDIMGLSGWWVYPAVKFTDAFLELIE